MGDNPSKQITMQINIANKRNKSTP